MKKNGKTIIGLLIAFIIGISTTVTAATVFNSKDITYSSDKTTKKNVKDALDELYNKAGKCPDGKWCYNEPMTLADKVELGDYISMTPTSTSYKPKSEDTGCMDDKNCTQNTINPSELNLWRVIRKNDDGTVDAVSEYVSSLVVYFKGQTGYKNYIGALNTIASQYTNTKYVSKTRHMGYINQTLICTSLETCLSESVSRIDLDLVTAAIGNRLGATPEGEVVSYWVSGRFVDSKSLEGTTFYDGYRLTVEDKYTANNCGMFSVTSSGGRDMRQGYAVRPILTLKSEIQIKSGDGKSASTAYTFK